MEDAPQETRVGVPSREQQSWGAVISICIILVMIVVGAFYAWGKRVHENNPPAASSTVTDY